MSRANRNIIHIRPITAEQRKCLIYHGFAKTKSKDAQKANFEKAGGRSAGRVGEGWQTEGLTYEAAYLRAVMELRRLLSAPSNKIGLERPSRGLAISMPRPE
jgi:hypothetical protein